MNNIIGPAEVEAEIMRLSGLLDLATTEIAKRARARAVAKADYKVAFAKARLLATGRVAERDDAATIDTEEEKP